MEIEVSVNDMSPAHRASVRGDRDHLEQILQVRLITNFIQNFSTFCDLRKNRS